MEPRVRSIIDILDLSVEELDDLIAVANDIIAHPKDYADACRGLRPCVELLPEPDRKSVV